MLRKKIVLVPMDLSKPDLGLNPATRDELVNKLNVIINSAGSVEFNERLDRQVDTNVRGPLNLLKLASECHNFECFAQVSTCYAICEKIGFLDEKMHESTHIWEQKYQQILQMNYEEVMQNEKKLIGNFPNNYCFSKRMAEELLVSF